MQILIFNFSLGVHVVDHVSVVSINNKVPLSSSLVYRICVPKSILILNVKDAFLKYTNLNL